MSIGTASRQISEVDVTRDLIEGTTAFIRDYLKAHGIDFEGRPLPVSFVPTLIKEHDLHSAVGTIRAIRQILNRVIDEFILQHSAGQTDGPLHEFFRPYEKWWQLIASERRSLPHINLMRYDAIFDRHGRWSLLETNTACPGGTIHCARIRSAWLASPFGRAITASLDIIDQPIDSPDCFVRHLVKLACAVAGQRSPNIALCTYRGLYPNELDSLKAEFDRKRRYCRRHSRCLRYSRAIVQRWDSKLSRSTHPFDPQQTRSTSDRAERSGAPTLGTGGILGKDPIPERPGRILLNGGQAHICPVVGSTLARRTGHR
jgi:hypothetical protein